MNETSKSLRRRWQEDARGEFPWRSIFSGSMLDVGAGSDCLPFAGVIPFDKEDGDANYLSQYFPTDHFDLVHSSNCLEHLNDPRYALKEWIKVTKAGGHILWTCPVMELYGDILWGPNGSTHNGDHKMTFSFGLKRSGAPIHIYMPNFVKELEKDFGVKVLLARVVDTNYEFSVGFTKDQTLDENAGVECWVECLMRKL